MATGSATREFHATLVASTQDTITLNAVYRTIQIENRGSGDIFVNAGSDLTPPATVTVGLVESWVVPANSARQIVVNSPAPSASNATNPTTTIVKLISSGTPGYSVIGN